MAANPYGPVTTTDTTQLTDDDWELPLPPIKYKRYPGTEKIKSLCYEVRQHHKNITIATTGVCVMIVFAMVIILAIGHNSKKCPISTNTKWQSISQGLEFYPVPEDKTILISFSPNDFSKLVPHPLKQSLDNVLGNYSTVKQLNEAVFTDCNSTYNPKDKTCRVSRNLFGDTCTSYRNYGYFGGQPCVFIQLNLSNGVTIKPITSDSPLWETAKDSVENLHDTTYVPFTCEGTTTIDKDVLMSVKGHGPNGETIMYYPRQGMQSYIYRERNTNLPFLKPAVMVQFTSLVSGRVVHVTCTAWGQLYDAQDTIIDHNLLTTHFALLVSHD